MMGHNLTIPSKPDTGTTMDDEGQLGTAAGVFPIDVDAVTGYNLFKKRYNLFKKHSGLYESNISTCFMCDLIDQILKQLKPTELDMMSH